MINRIGNFTPIANCNNYRGISFTSNSIRRDTIEISSKQKYRYINTDDTSLFDGYSKKRIKSFDEIAPENLVMIHKTDYFPEKGTIKSLRNSIENEQGQKGFRSTVHFSMNQPVKSHMLGNWDNKKFAIIMPFKDTMNDKSNIAIGGKLNDFAMSGNVELPDNAIIVQYNKEIPEGKLRISKDKETGIKIVETSESNVSKTTETVIKKMGYTTFKDLVESDENITSDDIENAWDNFCAEQNYINMHATYLPHHQADSLFPTLYFLNLLDDWTGVDLFGCDLDYKQELLSVIKDIKQNTPKNKPLNFDIEKLERIITDSDTPESAYKKAQDEFGFYFIPQETNSLFSPNKNRQMIIEDLRKDIIEKFYKPMEENYIKNFGEEQRENFKMCFKDAYISGKLKSIISECVRATINISSENDDNYLTEIPDIIEEYRN